MKKNTSIIIGIIIMLFSSFFQMSCATMFLRCAGCTISEAYSDPTALKLVKAAVGGNSKKVADLVKEGANPNHLEPDKVPMLLWTICGQNVEGFEALLKAGADPNLGGTGHGRGQGDQGRREGVSSIPINWSAMTFAASINNPEFLRLAIQYGGDLNTEKRGEKAASESGIPLLVAAYHGLFDNVKLLVESGADINVHTETDSAPEMAIGVGGRFDIAIWFLEHGYTYNLLGLAKTAEGRVVNQALQPYKEKFIDMLTEKGIQFPVTDVYKELHKYRELPPGAMQDIVYGRKGCRDFPLKPGRYNDRTCWGGEMPSGSRKQQNDI
ncbi:ankyrin repeat domain-containing protein [Leptospira inadai]|uniref:Ankyrin repeat domain-containing protein n=1 Tax=Leptospira inadai serovar Lyme TaxID=293084 RepID=A0ABX4YDE2_9LEPT|nr:ankyrin repeat domain-containing protein [Leptospira inadai]PNV72269.1 ankyrin repeat domain-containing protein [Leptospira inadai serovar Lyme]